MSGVRGPRDVGPLGRCELSGAQNSPLRGQVFDEQGFCPAHHATGYGNGVLKGLRVVRRKLVCCGQQGVTLFVFLIGFSLEVVCRQPLDLGGCIAAYLRDLLE